MLTQLQPFRGIITALRYFSKVETILYPPNYDIRKEVSHLTMSIHTFSHRLAIVCISESIYKHAYIYVYTCVHNILNECALL